jgi:hypothetical protein
MTYRYQLIRRDLLLAIEIWALYSSVLINN